MKLRTALLGFALLCTPMLAAAQANISNGTVRIGVRADGALMPSVDGPTTGITFLATGNDGLTPGCLCEAWGIADAISGQSGHAGADTGSAGITSESFTSTATTATSVVNAFGKFRVTHSFTPSTASPNLFDVRVTIQNISAANTQVLYGRAMDWDIPPTAFAELVTLQRGNSPALVFSSDNGFHNADPLNPDSGTNFTNQDVVDDGPTDHGAHFRFNFGNLAPGASLQFTIAYGAAASTAQANAALAAFGAESYSLGKPSSSNDGTPNAFIFAFKGTGGTPVDPENPVDTGATTCASEGYTGTKLLWCQNICEKGYTGSTLAMWIRRWTDRYRDLPYCAANPPPPPPPPPQEA